MADVDAEVIIVGGGIGGLTLAAILRRLSISCRVLERTEVLRPVGAGISLAPNALRLLDQLGLYDKILAAGQKLRKLQIHRNTTLWNTVDWSGCEPTFGYPVVSIERHHFHRLLYEAAGAGATVQLGARVVDVVDEPGSDGSNPVRVVLESGKELKARVVVGADGIRSVLRRVLARNAGLKEANTIRFTGRVHMSGITAPLEHLGSDELGVANWVLYDDSILTTWPCTDNRQWFIGVKRADGPVDNDRSVWGTTTPDDIKQVYGERFHPFAQSGKFGEIVDRSERILASNVFQEVEFPSMARGRVALLGDAAHSMTSFFGQGACQAIEDAAVLGNLLAEVSKSQIASDASAILEAYSSARQDRVRSLVDFSGSFAALHMAKLPYGLGPLARRLIYTWAPGWAWLWYLRWLYGYQPAVARLSGDSDPNSNGHNARKA